MCAFMQVSSEGGPANLLKTQNLKIHQRAYEPEGQEFESLRARQSIKHLGDSPKCLVDGTLRKRSSARYVSAVQLPSTTPERLLLDATGTAPNFSGARCA